MRILANLIVILVLVPGVPGLTVAQEFSPLDREKLRQAEIVADRFVERFRQTLDFETVWNGFKASNLKCTYEASGFFSENDLKRLKFDDALLERLYISSKNYYYLNGAYSLSLVDMNDDRAVEQFLRKTPREIRRAERKLYGMDATLLTARDVEKMIGQFNHLANLLRKHMPRYAMRSQHGERIITIS